MDISQMVVEEGFFERMEPAINRALVSMRELEGGAIANPDERRMVGHYWLRNAALAPTKEITREIERMHEDVKTFVRDILSGRKSGVRGAFNRALIIGIGGSALGPQFVGKALGVAGRGLTLSFFDNTDPDGMDAVLAGLREELDRTLVVVISKSGGTIETRNGMIEARKAFSDAGMRFEERAVAITGDGSELWQVAKEEGWRAIFPMWDWVGGRTSELSAVGLVPAALQGIDIDELLRGARLTDEVTRSRTAWDNPAALMAAMWYVAGNGKGERDLVVIPYKDRLELFSRYLQQLIMESLGKEFDLEGGQVNQGLAVYGNKGSTDQHAYVQQLRDGIANFFVTFINVLEDRCTLGVEVEPGVQSGDYLNGFFLGTRAALAEKHRQSLTITIDSVSPFSVGALIALFERAVGLYASLINVNAYHQPGVEAGKKAAAKVIALQNKVVEVLRENTGTFLSMDALVMKASAAGEEINLFYVCRHLSSNKRFGVEGRVNGEEWEFRHSGR